VAVDNEQILVVYLRLLVVVVQCWAAADVSL